MFQRGNSCKNCGTKLTAQDRYCTNCGTPQAGQMIQCGQCQKQIKADSRFCPYCGQTVTAVAAPTIRQNRWTRQEGDLAVRIEGDDLAGMARRVIVNPGTQAIITDNGRTQEVYGPGSYTLDSLGERFQQFFGLQAGGRRAAIIVDTQPFDLTFAVQGIFTQDPIRVGLNVQVKLQVNDPIPFYLTMLRDRVRFGQADLHAYLLPEVEDVANEWLHGRTIADLTVNLDARVELETTLEVILEKTLATAGLIFKQLRTFDYHMPHVDKITGVRENYLLQVSEREAELDGRRRVFDVFQAEQLQDIAEETQKVEMFERKAKVRQRMRQAILADKFDEIRSEQETEQFLRQIDKENLLTDDEWDRLKRTIQWRRDDDLRQRENELQDTDWARSIQLAERDRNRAHLLARLELENKFELAQLDLRQRLELEPEQLAFEQAMARQRMEGEMALEAKRQGQEIAKRRTEQAAALEMQRTQDEYDQEKKGKDRQNLIENAKTQVQIAEMFDDQETKEILRDLDIAAKGFSVIGDKKDRDETRKIHSAEEEARIRQDEADRIHAREMEKEKARNQFEVNIIERIAGIENPMSLIALAKDNEKAQLIHDLQQTETMKEMSQEQILARFIDKSPEAGKALAEIAKAAAAGQFGVEQREMYERLLQQIQAETERMERIRQQDISDRQAERASIRDIIQTQLGGMADIERAKASQPGPAGPTVVVPGIGGGYATIGGAAQGSGALRCPKCSEVVTEGANFCPNCQHKLRGG